MEKIITREAGSVIYKAAVICLAGLIGFFLLVKALGFAHITQLRLINLLILFFAIRHVLRQERREDNNRLEYLTGLMHGTFLSILVSIGFAAFVFFYLSYLDRSLLQHMIQHEVFGEFLNPLSAALITFVEGLASGTVLSFVLMRVLKRDPGAAS